MKSLKMRRLEAITRFAHKSIQSEKYNQWFCQSGEEPPPTNIGPRLRSGRKPVPRLKPIVCRTQRYENSSLPLMTKLLAWHPPMVYTPIHIN